MAAAEDTHWWYRLLHREVAYWIAKSYSAQPCQHLDAGCGTGGLSRYLLSRFSNIEICGLEFSKLGLALARERHATLPKQANLIRGSILDIPFGNDSFDVVTTMDVLYISGLYENMQQALCECRRVLRPAGMLIMQLPALQWLFSQHDINVHGAHRFTKAEVRSALEAAGFEVRTIYYRYPSLVLPAKLIRKASDEVGNSYVQEQDGVANRMLTACFALECAISRKIPWPLGTSVFAVARKKA